jgi:hypothetical protein
MDTERSTIPTRFELKWLLGPLVIILAAGLIALYLPTVSTPSPSLPFTPLEQPVLVETPIDVEAAQLEAASQCSLTFSCEKFDCLEKILTHIDASTVSIDAVLRTPAPKLLRDHLRLAIKRGVIVRLVLDPTLNPKFYLQGALVHIKQVDRFVASNFMIIDSKKVVYGTDPQTYASYPDVIRVACTESERVPYSDLFERVWTDESVPFVSETTVEESVDDASLSVPSGENMCSSSDCGTDTYTCVGTTKMYQDYFCDGTACAYQIIPLAYSSDCGYTNPGFAPDGSPLIIITETEVDEGQVANEFIEFTALSPVELTGFTLLRDDNTLITFSAPFILNGAARVYTGNGTPVTTVVYLQYSSALWDASGTTATLFNPNNVMVATRTFE